MSLLIIRERPDRFTSASYLDRIRIVLRVLTVYSTSLISCNSVSLYLFLVSIHIGCRDPHNRKFSSGVGKRFSSSRTLALYRKSQGLFFDDVVTSDVVFRRPCGQHMRLNPETFFMAMNRYSRNSKRALS